MAANLPATKQEVINIGLLTLLAAITGIGSFILRTHLPRQVVPPAVEILQYSLAHMLLGLMPILAIRARTVEGRVTAIYLLIGLGTGLLLIPFDLVLNTFLSLTILVGGLVYFRFFRASNVWLLLLVGFFVVEFYVYGMWTIVSAVSRTGRLRLGIVAILLTVMLAAIGRMFLEEFRKSNTGGKWPI